MRNNLRRTGQYGDTKLNELARDVQRGFDSINDQTTHKITIVWNPPFLLLVPYFGGEPRTKSPDFVDCKRAVNLTDSTILVTPGSCAFDWVGNGQVSITAAAGLTIGQKYELVFSVVG